MGSLVADMRLNSSAFTRDLGKARRDVASNSAQMKKSMRSIEQASRNVSKRFGQLRGAAVALGGALAVRQFTSFAKAAIKSADSIAKQSRQLKIAASEFQRYRIEGEIAGVETAKLESGLGAFVKRVGELRAGTGTLVTILDKSNVSLKNQLLAATSSEQGFRIMLKAIRESESAFDKQALAAAAFGRQAGQSMVLLANSIGTLDAEMVKLVQRSDTVLASGEKLNDQFTLLQTTFGAGFDTAIINDLSGSVGDLKNGMVEARTLGEQFGKAVGTSLRAVAEAAKFAGRHMREIGAAIAAVVAFKGAAIFGGIAVAVGRFALSLKAAATSAAALNVALKLNPIAIAIGLAASAAVLLATNTNKAEEAARRHREAIDAVKAALGKSAPEFKQASKSARRLAEDDITAAEARLRLIDVLIASQGVGMLGNDTATSRQLAEIKALGERIAETKRGLQDLAAAGKEASAEIAEANKAAADAAPLKAFTADMAKVVAGWKAAAEERKKTAAAIAKSTSALKVEAHQQRLLARALKVSQAEYERVKEKIDLANAAAKLGKGVTDKQAGAYVEAFRKAQKFRKELVNLKKAQQGAKATIASLTTTTDRYNDEVKSLDDQLRRKLITEDQHAEAVRNMRSELLGVTDATRQYQDRLNHLNAAREHGILNEQQQANAVGYARLEMLRMQAEQQRTFGAGARLASAQYFDGIRSHSENARQFVGNAFTGLEGTLSDFFASGEVSFGRFTDLVKRGLADIAAKGVISVAGSFAKGALETVGGSIGSRIANTVFAAEGGLITGPGSDRSDNIPAMLSPGEFVVNAASVRKYGRGLFHQLNAGDRGPVETASGLPGFGFGSFISKAFKSVAKVVKKVAGFIVSSIKGTIQGLASGDPLAIAAIVSSFVLPGITTAISGAVSSAQAAVAFGGNLSAGAGFGAAASLSGQIGTIARAISSGISDSFASGILGGSFSPTSVASSLVSGAVGKAATTAVSETLVGGPADKSGLAQTFIAGEGGRFAKSIGGSFDKLVVDAAPFLADVPQFKKGGFVPNTGLANLHSGEFVVNSQAVDRVGAKNLARLNTGAIQAGDAANDNIARAIANDSRIQSDNFHRLEETIAEGLGALQREIRNMQGADRVAGVRAA
jgi:hypothetical protein